MTWRSSNGDLAVWVAGRRAGPRVAREGDAPTSAHALTDAGSEGHVSPQVDQGPIPLWSPAQTSGLRPSQVRALPRRPGTTPSLEILYQVLGEDDGTADGDGSSVGAGLAVDRSSAGSFVADGVVDRRTTPRLAAGGHRRPPAADHHGWTQPTCP